MPETPPPDATDLLKAAAEGSREAQAAFFELVYGELRALAAAYLRQERAGHTLQPTALAHEAYLRLVRGAEQHIENRQHFFALAATAMRRVLVNHARDRARQKRGAGRRQVSFDAALDTPGVLPEDAIELLALDDALESLAAVDERKARLVELRFYGGLLNEQAAEVLGISRSTVAEEWRVARAWLHRRLEGAAP